MPAPSPPQTLQPDPLALYGRTDEPGAGPVQIVQRSPISAGDTVARNAAGEWVNAPGETGVVTIASLLGNLRQEGNTARPARSNLVQAASASALKDETAALITKEALLIPIPVAVGDVFKTITLLIGATAASGPEHSWGALYSGELTSGEATILGEQSVDGKTAAIAAKKPFGIVLPAAVTITSAMAPHGIIYASVSVTVSTTEPSVVGVTGTAAIQESLAAVTGAPLAPSKFSVSGTEAVAKTPTGTLTAVVKYPLVILS